MIFFPGCNPLAPAASHVEEMKPHKTIAVKAGRALRRFGPAALLLVSLYCLSRPSRHRPETAPDADCVLLRQRPVNEGMVSPAFSDNRGNIAWSADPRGNDRIAKGKAYVQKTARHDTY